MEWAALITWVITAGGGFVLLSIWLSRGGMRQGAEGGSRIRPPLILSHFLLAATGLVLWIIYLVSDSEAPLSAKLTLLDEDARVPVNGHEQAKAALQRNLRDLEAAR